MASKRRFSYRWRLFIPMLGMMWLIVGVLMGYQNYHEREYRKQTIERQLNVLNARILDAYERDVSLTPFLSFVSQFFDNSIYDQVMVSVYNQDGNLLYSIGAPIPAEYNDDDGLKEVDDAEDGAESHRLVYVTSQQSSNGDSGKDSDAFFRRAYGFASGRT